MSQVRRTYRTDGAKTFVPVESSVFVECLGAGGGGGGGSVGNGGGGGGGAYAASQLTLTVGATYQATVGNGGANGAAAAAGQVGQASAFNSVADSTVRSGPTRAFTGDNRTDQAACAAIVLQPAVSGGTITLVGTAGVAGENATYPVNLPAGLQAGDIVLASVQTNVQNSPAPAGWTIQQSLLGTYYIATHTVASSAESGTDPGWGPLRAISYSVWRGVDSVNFDSLFNVGSANDSNTVTVTYPASATYKNGSVRVFLSSGRAGGTGETSLVYTIPSGVTSLFNASSTGNTSVTNAGRSAFQAYDTLSITPVGATLVSAAPGGAGGAGGLGAGSVGQGGTAAASTGTTKTGGAPAGAGGSAGYGAAPLGFIDGPTALSNPGRGGNGGPALSAGTPGNDGAIRLSWPIADGTAVASAEISYRVRVRKAVPGVGTGTKALLIARAQRTVSAVGAPVKQQRTAPVPYSRTAIGTPTESQRTRKTITATGVGSPSKKVRVRSTRTASAVGSSFIMRSWRAFREDTAIGVATPTRRQKTRTSETATGVGTSTFVRKLILKRYRTTDAIGTPTKTARVRSRRTTTGVGTPSFDRTLIFTRMFTATGVGTTSFQRVIVFVRNVSVFGIGSAKGRIALDMDDLPTSEGGGGNTYVTPLFVFDD